MTPAEEIVGFEDVHMAVQVELARRVMTVREVLQLDVDSVLKMNRSAGENLDLWIGGALIGFGEIVIAETTTGLRITDFNVKE
ncbi:MAG: FliM/FliN family flagellar motor switch protein [Acidobacteriaceae bacterium]|nr:FliM/FliN family flagellar motor switch protein [Acidobacteriaceae bacterium]